MKHWWEGDDVTSSERRKPADVLVDEQPVTSTRMRVLFLLLLVGVLLAVLDQTVTGTAAWTIVRDLGGTSALSEIPWLATAYLVSSTVGTPLFGRMSDLYGRRRGYVVAIVLFVAGSIAAAFTGDLTQLIAGRALQGLGAGGMIALTFAVVADIVPPRDRGRYTGLAMGVVALASVGGPLLGGFFAGHGDLLGLTTSWRWVFYINLPFAVAAVAVVALIPPTVRAVGEKRGGIDYLGTALMVAGVWALLLVGEWGGQSYPWSSPVILGLAAAGVLLLALFGVRERSTATPLLPVTLFHNPIFGVANLISFTVGAALLGSVFYVTLYLQVATGLDPAGAGLGVIPLMLGLAVASAVAGQLMANKGRYKVFPIVGTAMAAVGLGSLVLLQADTSAWLLSFLLLVVGVGVGTATSVLPVAVLNAVPANEYGVASSSTTFTQTLGGVVGAAVFGALLNARMRDLGVSADTSALDTLPPPARAAAVNAFVQASHAVFLAAAGVLLVAFGLSLFLREIPLRKGLDPAAA
jgi:EmrB/QacA subfamily drug resistance transporter